MRCRDPRSAPRLPALAEDGTPVARGPGRWAVRHFRTLKEVFHLYLDPAGVLRTDHDIRFLGLLVVRAAIRVFVRVAVVAAGIVLAVAAAPVTLVAAYAASFILPVLISDKALKGRNASMSKTNTVP